jgi:isopenicillin-N epimerase
VVPLPDGSFQTLQDVLLKRYAIEVPIIPFPTIHSRLLRVSAQLYNTSSQYQWLAQAMIELLHEESKPDMNK